MGGSGANMSNIGTFFENYLKQDSLFKDKSVLLSSYIPDEIIYREDLLREVANILAPALKIEKPSNLFIYGKTGTGKTLSVRYILKYMHDTATSNNINL